MGPLPLLQFLAGGHCLPPVLAIDGFVGEDQGMGSGGVLQISVQACEDGLPSAPWEDAHLCCPQAQQWALLSMGSFTWLCLCLCLCPYLSLWGW